MGSESRNSNTVQSARGQAPSPQYTPRPTYSNSFTLHGSARHCTEDHAHRLGKGQLRGGSREEPDRHWPFTPHQPQLGDAVQDAHLVPAHGDRVTMGARHRSG